MTGRSDMQEVELLDGDDLPEPPATPARRGRRRWWIAGGAVAVALVLGGTQLVVDAREEAAYQRLAAVPGVFPPLGDELVVLRRIRDTDATDLWAGVGIGDGRTAGLSVADDGSQSFAAIDQRTGELLWSVPLLGPNAERAASLRDGYGGWCLGDTARNEPATVAVCLVTDGFVRYDDDGAEERVPATSSRVMVLDTADGHVITEWTTEPTAQLAVLDGLVVVGTRDAERDVVVVGHDLRSGDERWRYEDPSDDDAPAASDYPGSFWGLFGAGRSAVGIYDGEVITVLSSTGAAVRDGIRLSTRGGGFGTDPVTGAFSISTDTTDGDPTTMLLAPDADPAADVVVPGELLQADVDDSSLRSTVLTYDSHTSAWDRATGKEIWEADVRPNGGCLVIHGLVYLTSSTDIVALDGRTGETVWSTPLPTFAGGVLAADGRHLLLLSSEYDGARSGSGGVTLVDLATGDEVGQLPYPEGVTDLQPMHGLLVGWAYATEEVVVLE